MFSSIGDRITYCRGLLGLSRKELSKHLTVAIPTLARWELNYIKIPQKKLQLITDYLNCNNIKISIEWLRTGDGLPPINLNQKDFEEDNFDNAIFLNANQLANQIKNFQFKQINNNFFEPVISYGDYIGGLISTSLELIDNKLCFVITPKETLVGYYHHEKSIVRNLHNKHKDVNIGECAVGELMWLARRP